LIYFVHQFQPKFDEHALLDDEPMLKAVTALNAEIQKYAAIIETGTPMPGKVAGADSRCLKYRGQTYIFLVNPTGSIASVATGALGSFVDSETGIPVTGLNLAPYGVQILLSKAPAILR
jgi:hypothetical protein